MKTFIITRFNLPVKFTNPKFTTHPLNDEWLSHRTSLFKEYCLPSISAQTDHDFSWFIIFHPDTPAKYYEYIPKKYNLIFSFSIEDAMQQIKSNLGDNDSFLSIRLDNDDALSKNYIKSIKALISAMQKSKDIFGSNFGINPANGIEHDINDGSVYDRYFPASSFSCLFESDCSANNIKTIMGYHHAHLHKEVPVTNLITKQPMWMMVIHDKNVGNQIKGEKSTKHHDEIIKFFS